MKTHSLTLTEAVNSGRPFRHKSWGSNLWVPAGVSHDGRVSYREAISSEWEIQIKDSFTRADVENALRFAFQNFSNNRPGYDFGADLQEAMKAAESSDMASKESV